MTCSCWGLRMGFPGKWCDGDDIPWTDRIKDAVAIASQKSHCLCSICRNWTSDQSTRLHAVHPGNPGQINAGGHQPNRDAEEVDEKETNILLKGCTNMRQIREADNQVDHLRSNAAYENVSWRTGTGTSPPWIAAKQSLQTKPTDDWSSSASCSRTQLHGWWCIMVSAWKQDATCQFLHQFEKHKIGGNHRILERILIIGTFTRRALGAHINFAIELIRKVNCLRIVECRWIRRGRRLKRRHCLADEDANPRRRRGCYGYTAASCSVKGGGRSPGNGAHRRFETNNVKHEKF